MKFTPAVILLACLLLFTIGSACKKKKDPDPVNPTTTSSQYDFTWSANPRAGYAITFTSNVPEGHSLTWKIDTATSAGRVAYHTFSKGGSYNVSLTVDNDLSKVVTKTITVDNPFVSFGYSGVPVVGDTIRFHTINGSSGKTFSWDFGDGSTSTDLDPAHVYTAPGSYNIKLRVDNAYDASGNVKVVIVNDPLYTHKITKSRTWQFNNYRKYSDGTDTSYTTTETFSIETVNKIKVAMPASATLPSFMWLDYDPSLSKGNVLVFTHFNRKLYFDHVMDTVYLSDWDHYGKYNTQGVPTYDHFVTGSSK